MNNNMETTVTTTIGTTSEEESNWSRLIVLVFSAWICKNVLPIFLNEATALNILKHHKIRPDGKSLYDKAEQGYARRLQELVLKQTHR